MPLTPKTKYRLQTILQFIITGYFLGIALAYLTYLTIPEESLTDVIGRGMLFGALIGACIGFIEEWLLEDKLQSKPFWQVTMIRVFLYGIVIVFWLVGINTFIILHNYDTTYSESFTSYVLTGTCLQDVIFAFIASLLTASLFQIKKLHRPGDLLNFVLGRFNTPTEVERIFIFIDLKSSTSIAEKLGHLQYSYFLKDYFADMTEAILVTQGEIYQYVGDEIIITWKIKKGVKNANCLRCFYYLQSQFSQLEEKYLQKYGYSPRFKAGLHGGKVITTWVGELKKEIVFTGDVLNTTARIQEKCNSLNAELLISGDLLGRLNLGNKYKAQLEDTLQLRGKQEEIALYSLQKMS